MGIERKCRLNNILIPFLFVCGGYNPVKYKIVKSGEVGTG